MEGQCTAAGQALASPVPAGNTYRMNGPKDSKQPPTSVCPLLLCVLICIDFMFLCEGKKGKKGMNLIFWESVNDSCRNLKEEKKMEGNGAFKLVK